MLLKYAADTGRAKARKPAERWGPTKAKGAKGAKIWAKWIKIPETEVKEMTTSGRLRPAKGPRKLRLPMEIISKGQVTACQSPGFQS